MCARSQAENLVKGITMTPEDIQSIAETVRIMKGLTSSEPNEWLPVYAALGGAIAGAIASFFPSWMMELRKEAAFSKKIERCLLSEISAIVEIVEHRGYLLTLKKIITHLRESPEGTLYCFYVDVPQHYSRIYQDNCKHIGAITEDTAQKIIYFHQLLDAVIQDIKPDGIFSDGTTLEHFEEMEIIFCEAVNMAKELTKNINTEKPRTYR